MDSIAQRALHPLVALLALAVLLVGVFAIHSEVTGHDQHVMAPTVSAVTGHVHETLSLAAAPVAAASETLVSVTTASLAATHMAVAPAVAAVSSGLLSGMLDCALIAITCVLLLILVAGVSLTRPPALYRRLLDTGRRSLGVARCVAEPVPCPSLTLLSIRRV
ncbi:MAG: hypothetical protein R6W83_02085 [Cryobacterium sp.]